MQRLWDRALAGELRGLVPALLVLNFALTLWTGLVTLRNFPNSADEYACVISAELFSRGRLSVPSPNPKSFFDLYHVVNDGRFYGKYPPGWPALLSIGILLGVPWLINPLIGVASLALIQHLARRFFSPGAGLLALLLLTANPFFIFNSASYFSHPACLLAVLGMLYGLFAALENPRDVRAFALLGFSTAAGLLIRPFTVVAVAAPLGLWFLWKTTRGGTWRASLDGLLVGGAVFGLLLVPFFVYNKALTGHPFLQPFEIYDPYDVLGFTGRYDTTETRIREAIVLRAEDLIRWLPLTLIAVAAVFFRDAARERLLVSTVLTIFAAYVFYWGTGGNRYGPRYLYEGTGALVLAAAAALDRRRGVAPALIALALLIHVAVFVRSTGFHAAQVRERMRIYDLVREEGIKGAVVFLRSGCGTMPQADLTRNGTRFDGEVLYVHDREEENERLMAAFPGRRAWRFEHGTLTPLSEQGR